MRRWALAVVGLYVLVLLAITGPLGLLTVVHGPPDWISPYRDPTLWVWAGVMALCQWALLLIPVRVARQRPAARRSLLVPVVVGGLLAALLLAGAMMCARALFWGDAASPRWYRWTALALAALTWLGWSMLFHRMGRTSEPRDFVTAQCRTLFRGSVLELLVAVPSHIVMRNKHVCCADVLTFVGLTFGISVMLISFGPALFFLFAARWGRLRPTRPGVAGADPDPGHASL